MVGLLMFSCIFSIFALIDSMVGLLTSLKNRRCNSSCQSNPIICPFLRYLPASVGWRPIDDRWNWRGQNIHGSSPFPEMYPHDNVRLLRSQTGHLPFLSRSACVLLSF